MAKNPVFPLYYNDLDRSTRDWSDEEYGAYVRLLVHQWDKGCLPKDYQRLTRIATSLDANWPAIKCKFKEVDGGFQNENLEAIRTKWLKHRERQKKNAEKRYQNAAKTLPLEDEYENNNKESNGIHKDSTGILKEIGSEKVTEIANEVWSDQSWKNNICMGLSITIDELKKWMALFNSSISNDIVVDFNKSRYKKMIRGWITTQQAKGTKVETGVQKKSTAPPLTTIKPS